MKEQLHELWRAAGGTHEILDVDTIQGERIRSVYRLRFRDGRPPVIAKHCPTEDAETEFHVYRDILPSSAISAPEAYGLVPSDTPRRSWMFMGEISGRPYDPTSETDRELAGDWLAMLHTQADRPDQFPRLGERSCDHYSYFVLKSHELLSHHCGNDALSRDNQRLLRRLLDLSTMIVGHWPAITAFCKSMPQTLVHGDFKEDNMRIVESDAGPKVVAFDWARAGWGAPGLDLAKFTGYSVDPDLQPYLARCQRRWPSIDKAAIIRLAYIGEIYRWSETVRWHIEEIDYGRTSSVMSRMAVYETWMLDIIRMEPWKETDLVSTGRWQAFKKCWR